ncbi:flavin dependent monooxygenase [Pyrenophora seminiperda CCB06]|uniref:Flavin dependent monooxygenase n=1 Tax=Pyrenophora seminiperda CCB06 TaxID=1302712 RepID=A0A3M7M0T2_9PLEO|nr:flavin dependent monooxygenase [Pyrenophora seminiperda CCB06]
MIENEKISIKAKTVAVVGAGPSGVIAAKYLRAEKAFDKIVLFEQRSQDGGIWIYTGDQRDENLFNIPQTDPEPGVQEPEWQNGASKIPSFLSPMYETLETNIPRGLMGFQDLDWPSDSQLFPTHETVLKYIQDYAADVQDHIQYCTQVTHITPTDAHSPTTSWTITTQNLLTQQSTTETYDAVIVANGHFIVPHIPSIPSIQEWASAHPNRITHSKYYRLASDFSHKKVIVVGNSASGADISWQIAQHCTLPLLWSTRSDSLFSATHGTAADNTQERRLVPQIKRFLPETAGVEFTDGTTEHDIDAVVFATGYFYSLPFLQDVRPKLITSGERVEHTYQHIFYAPQPTLSFLALPQRVIPFPLAEAQAAVVSRVYAGRIGLPPLSTMKQWDADTQAEMGAGRNFHLLPFPKDANYINEMSAWAMEAGRKEGLEREGRGKVPPVWGQWEFRCRERFPEIRRAFGERGEERKGIRDVGELGFDFGKR